jgi:Family of unknown function (DUF6502)
MSRPVRAAVNGATLRLLEPFAQFLLDARVGVGEFTTLARRAYVKAALRDPANFRSGRVNVSRVAAATGLSRVEIAALLIEDGGGPARKPKGRVQAERVLLGWWNDPKFRDHSGAPVRLPRRGATRSFAALVKQHSGDAHNSAPILEELLRSQAVREHPDGTLEAISRTCTNVRWDEEGIEAFGEELSEHLETLLYNLKHPEHPRFAKRVVCAELDAQAARVLIPELIEQAELFLEGAEESLGRPARARKGASLPASAMRFSVGLQFYQAPVPPPSPKKRREPRRPRGLPRTGAL